jgi:nitroreductase
MMTEPNLLRVLEAHRSIRRYKPEPIPREHIQRMMAAAQRASTGGTGQLYSLVRVTERELRERLAEMTGQAHVTSAAEFFIACLDTHRLRRLLEQRGLSPGVRPLSLYATTDALLALANLATAAEALGYGICYVGSLQRELQALIALLHLPEGVCPLLGLCVGVADESPEPSPRLPADVVFHENRYHEPTAEDLEHCYEAMAGATYAGGWFNSLSQYFMAGQEYEAREKHWQSALARQGFKASV